MPCSFEEPFLALLLGVFFISHLKGQGKGEVAHLLGFSAS